MLELTVLDAGGTVLGSSSAADEVFLVHDGTYPEDCVLTLSAPAGAVVWIVLDDAVAPALLHLPGGRFSYPVPGPAQADGYSPRAFAGGRHRLQARIARPEEIALRRDLALNPLDHAGSEAFPHAVASVVTRGEAGFAARCAIDGEAANDDHGRWPYTSWGIAEDPNAALTIQFGRPVRIDTVALTLRADFPHDAWWTRASVTFDDGSTEQLTLSKTGARQSFAMTPRTSRQLVLHDLIRAEDPSPFPALTRIEVLGVDKG
ncbi:carbohydrate-binding protein [Pseudoroseicyclus aestuarii]|uniref:Carbohydrate-binding protein n=1 Tax=Pseudoroseicyclus aestuarii TaxID=1795041 RepID=A0A318TD57_9RHOB|nr:carbohydrate-binding protein [Pseudoroseicyclus aestuarii]PYE86258.1 hypothetical protein DFP88_101937 [Pseudoroseicyclus aestuarii]